MLVEFFLNDLQSFFARYEHPCPGDFDGVLERPFMLCHPEPYVVPETIAIIGLLRGNGADAIICDFFC